MAEIVDSYHAAVDRSSVPPPARAADTLDKLETNPHPFLAQLRVEEPVAWVKALRGWVITRRDDAISVMRDAETFTVDDPRFSTAQVVGPSMLSLDGPEHARHRAPFADAFRLRRVQRRFEESVTNQARDLVDGLAPTGHGELRRQLAGPLAVAVIADALGLRDVEASTVLGWYDAIVNAVDQISSGEEPGTAGSEAFGSLGNAVERSIGAGDSLLTEAASQLSVTEVVSNAAVMMFGGIETSEGMTANLLWHLLTNPDQLEAVQADRDLLNNAIEESLRMEPAAGRVDRYATRDVELRGTRIPAGDLVIVSLTGANRDPEIFEDPDRFDVMRENASDHLAFAVGPHVCVGMHLARLETRAALEAVFDRLPGIRLDPPGQDGPRGLIFRKPPTVEVSWDTA